jgi:archaellum biogenesis ATPase FlaH
MIEGPKTRGEEILGAILQNLELIAAAPELRSSDFTHEAEACLFSEILKQWEEARQIDEFELGEKVPGGQTYLQRIQTGMLSKSIEAFAADVRELKKLKHQERIFSLFEEQKKLVKRTGGDVAFEIDKLQTELDTIRALDKKVGVSLSGSLRKGSELQALDLKVDWLIDKLIPERSITLLHGRGGLGKTWLCLIIAQEITEGREFFSLQTKVRPVVYIDFENSLPLLIERIRKLNIRDVLFWHLSADLKPPKLDSENYIQYKELPPKSLLIFDSLRAAHDGDENSSRDMSLVMGHLKELRELGFTILLNHHTAKADERTYKGSTAISDLSDHVLSLHRVKRSTFEEIEDDLEPGPGDFFWFGTREKTRYSPFHLFLTFDADVGGFILAEDPDQDNLNAIAEFIRTADHTVNQSEIYTWAKGELEITKKGRLVAFLKKGERLNLWSSRQEKTEKNRRLYAPFNW